MKSAADLERLRKRVQAKVRLRKEGTWRIEINTTPEATQAGAYDLMRKLIDLSAHSSFPFQVMQNGNPDDRLHAFPVLKTISPKGHETIYEGVHADDLAAILSAMEKGG